MQEFINPKSMLTPGVAGSLMMFLVNGLTSQFPEIQPRYCALFLSCLIAGVVFIDKVVTKSMVEKGIYFLLNTLVIFVVGFGSANLAADASGKAPRRSGLAPLVSTAFAQEPSIVLAQAPSSGQQGTGAVVAPSTPANKTLEEQLEALRLENEHLKMQLDGGQQGGQVGKEPVQPPPAQKSPKFFKQW